jgi:hypothetical protein
MTNASDDDVISVYKKLSGDDEIEVVSDDKVKITDPESGNEYIVDLGGSQDAPAEEIEVPEIGEPEIGGEEEIEIENVEETVVYEIELQEEEEATNEDIVRGQGHDTHVSDTTAQTGDIESQTAPEDKENSGDNLEGGYDEDVTSGDGHAEHVMETEKVSEEEIAEETKVTETEEIEEAAGDTIFNQEPKGSVKEEEEVSEEEVAEGDEAIEEKIQVGKGRNVTTNKTKIQGAGGDANKVGKPNVTAPNESVDLEKYKALVKENEAFKGSLKKFRDMLNETVVFNSNLAYVVKLFTEHTTTKEEKKTIIERFDDNVSSLKESKKLYKTIVSELGSKKTVTESVEDKLNKENSSSKTQLTENTVYVDNSTKRMLDLIKRVENR